MYMREETRESRREVGEVEGDWGGEGGEVLAVPPLFLQESGHSGGIPVDSGGMGFGRRPC